MQLGISSTSLEADRLDELFQQAAAIGAEGLELACTDSASAVALLNEDRPKELVELCRQTGVALPSISLGVLTGRASLIGTDEQIETGKRDVRLALDAAAEAEAKILLVPFFGKNTIEVDDDLKRAADSLLDLADHAEQAGVVIAVETTLNFDQQEFLLNHVAHTGLVKIYADTGTALARKLDFATGIRDLGIDAIAQVHFKDARVTEGQPPEFNLALGEGGVDFHAAGRAIQAIGYDGWIILETPPGDDPIASGKANLAVARDALAAAG